MLWKRKEVESDCPLLAKIRKLGIPPEKVIQKSGASPEKTRQRDFNEVNGDVFSVERGCASYTPSPSTSIFNSRLSSPQPPLFFPFTQTPPPLLPALPLSSIRPPPAVKRTLLSPL